jgi:hypothetical protein
MSWVVDGEKATIVIRSIVTIVYLAAGAIIAQHHHYFSNLHSVRSIVSAILAVVLWPLILLGVNLRIK